METAITTIPGIGPSTAKILMEHGFKSLPEIAAATIAQVAAVPGFSTIRAGRIIKAANNLLSAQADGDAPAAQTTTSPPPRTIPKPTSGSLAVNETKVKTMNKKTQQEQDKLKKAKAKKAAEKKAKAKKIAAKKAAEKKAKAKKIAAKKAAEKKAKAKKVAAKKAAEKKAKAKKAKAKKAAEKKAATKKIGTKKGKSKS